MVLFYEGENSIAARCPDCKQFLQIIEGRFPKHGCWSDGKMLQEVHKEKLEKPGD